MSDRKVVVTASFLTAVTALCLDLDRYTLDQKTSSLVKNISGFIDDKIAAEHRRREYVAKKSR
jgi:hypothetical protein